MPINYDAPSSFTYGGTANRITADQIKSKANELAQGLGATLTPNGPVMGFITAYPGMVYQKQGNFLAGDEQKIPYYDSAWQAAPAPAPAPAPTPAPTPERTPKNPEPIVPTAEDPIRSPYQDAIDAINKAISGMSQATAPAPTPAPEPPKVLSATGSAVSGNAMGFVRKESRAKKSGATNKGTSQLKIASQGQTNRSSGLNIGI